jgi:hypothetical protein
VYSGSFLDDERSGQGTYTHPDGSAYEGGFARGAYEGHGVLTYSNGDVFRGTFERGLREVCDKEIKHSPQLIVKLYFAG